MKLDPEDSRAREAGEESKVTLAQSECQDPKVTWAKKENAAPWDLLACKAKRETLAFQELPE